jgi:hypothetical protein
MLLEQMRKRVESVIDLFEDTKKETSISGKGKKRSS